MMHAKDVMTTKLVTVGLDAAVEDIAKLFVERKISGVPVVDGQGRVLGIVSEGDLLRRPENETERRHSWWLDLISGSQENAAEYVKVHGSTAADVMSRDVVTVTEDSSMGDVAQILERRRIKRVPVVRDGKIVGIVSRANLLHGLVARKHHTAAPAPPDDHTLRQGVMKVLNAQNWATHGCLNAVVTNAKVELWGWVESNEERHALLVAAESVPGVRGVEDHLGSIPHYLEGA